MNKRDQDSVCLFVLLNNYESLIKLIIKMGLGVEYVLW